MKGTLKQWRMYNGLSQRQLAALLGKTDMTVSRWERGISEPTASDIAQIEKVLNINWSDCVVLVPNGVRKK